MTALVLKFVHLLCLKVRTLSESTPTDHLSDIDQARLYWLRDAQSQLQQDSKFSLWRYQFNLFVEESQLWRCGGRMSNSGLPTSAQTPILLDKSPIDSTNRDRCSSTCPAQWHQENAHRASFCLLVDTGETVCP